MNNSSKERNRQIAVLNYELSKAKKALASLVEPTTDEKYERVQYKGFYGSKERLHEFRTYALEFKINELETKLRNKGVKL